VKRTALFHRHVDLGAKMVPFAGFEMPIQYSSIIEEHSVVRERVGLFDLSHMGEFEIGGSGARQFLQKVTINDVARLEVGQAQYTAICNENGGIIDDCVLYRRDEDYLLVVNVSNILKDYDWLKEHQTENVLLRDVSDETTLIAVQGPDSHALLKNLNCDPWIGALSFYHHQETTFDSVTILCARTGYTGELGYELYLSNDDADRLWNALTAAGDSFGVKPVGLGARDTLRLEMGYVLYGNELDESTSPLEAGLGWITKLDQESFIGRDAILRLKSAGISRKLVAFEMEERGIPRNGYPILRDGAQVGQVTSGTFSPSLKKGIGIGFVEAEYGKPGSRVEISIRDAGIGAVIVKPPFWNSGTLTKEIE